MAHAALHKLVEIHNNHHQDPSRHTPHTVVALRSPEFTDRSTLKNAAVAPETAFPDLAQQVNADTHFFRDIDVIVATSGSSSGLPRLVGLSMDALLASAHATHAALKGPGVWILALPAHHIAGAQVLLRGAAHEIPPRIVDTSHGFDPRDLIPAITGAVSTQGLPAYLSLVPTQLRSCLNDEDVTRALATLDTVLVGGQSIDPLLLEKARSLKISIHTTYGMTETCGGCVYDGFPLPGVKLRIMEIDGQSRIAIAGPMLMTRYLDAESPIITDEDGERWLLTGDVGRIKSTGELEVLGRADSIITSGGLSIPPTPVRNAVCSTPGVVDAWVMGLPDETWGEVVAAAIVADPLPRGSAEVEEAARRIRDHVGATIGRPMAPRAFFFLETLPMGATGKVDAHALRTMLLSRVGTDDEWRR
ncbi:MAG: acyl-CoA synthetase [Actinobacteria bacterium]|nr:MAG: acyl-CoA synthetase [Actinomycetota bacterium]